MGKHEIGYERVERDFYPTPAWVTAALAEHVALTGLHVWEPACGTGSMAEALCAAGATVCATDIEDRGYDKIDLILDFTAPPPRMFYDGICTNPPYGLRNKLAERFIELGLERIPDDGFLALLLPNDFDSAKSRRHLFADCPSFSAKIVLTRRIVWFEHDQRAAPKENHSWFVWRKSYRLQPVILYGPRLLSRTNINSKPISEIPAAQAVGTADLVHEAGNSPPSS